MLGSNWYGSSQYRSIEMVGPDWIDRFLIRAREGCLPLVGGSTEAPSFLAWYISVNISLRLSCGP